MSNLFGLALILLIFPIWQWIDAKGDEARARAEKAQAEAEEAKARTRAYLSGQEL